ncbi:radical SAM/SPASM domain-containing protein [Tissierella sp.]|uniref:radical SAM/SPASM domain-containing protein n=1 Tax=Tissierella sp. TaxID=41274 RepID=UPI0028562A6B|nr:radical SAM protein [Tissierella sp.]MDR7856498.1 radical SAM protein [Tissierella sp.]
MKSSKYNIFIKNDDNFLAYNSRTSALAEVSHQQYDSILKILDNPNEEYDNNLKQNLLYGGFLILDQFDELASIKHDMYKERFSSESLNLTIAPTADCNFRCPYCYEKNVLENKVMTDDVEAKIISFINSKINSIQELSITWYGGEPLLECKRIDQMSQKIIALCDKNGVKYDAGIITNGYLLTIDNFLMLVKNKVKTIQITLDGTEETHDKRRYLKNRGKTFGKIVGNLYALVDLYKEKKEELPRINIRINVDQHNKEEAFKLLKDISDSPLSKFIVLDVAAVYDPMDVEHSYTLTLKEYIGVKNDFIDLCKSEGFQISNTLFYPKRVNAACVCDRINSSVIGPDGNMYKCWEEIGDTDACIGQVGINTVMNLPERYYDYMLFDPTLLEKCSNCNILPVCMGGGCPLRRSRDKIENCEQYIENVTSSVVKSYKSITANS